MKHYMFAALAAVPCIVSVASAATVEEYEAIINKSFSLCKKMVAIMESVKDKESADAAAEKLDKITMKAKKLQKKGKALGDPTDEQKKELEKRMESRKGEIMAMVTSAFSQMMRIGMEDCYGSEALKKSMETLNKTQGAMNINVSGGLDNPNIEVSPGGPKAPKASKKPKAPKAPVEQEQ